MPPYSKLRFQIEKRARRATESYPRMTIGYYGPDDTRASKVVIGVLRKEGDLDTLEKLFARDESEDVRYLDRINERILEIIQAKGVESVAMVDRLIGCPHEEGIDYPNDENCPQCPFWANRDRWAGVAPI